MKTKSVLLSEIAIDGGTQQRKRISTDVVSEYAEAIRCGTKFPPITLFFDGTQHWLADGFHRYHAHRGAEMLDILADVHEGTLDDAIWFSASANFSHGLRRSNEDKRNSVMNLLIHKRFTLLSNREIAKQCHVTSTMVDKLRKEINGEKKPAKKKVQTVCTPDPEANNDAGVVSESPKKEAASKPEPDTYDPDDEIVNELRDTVVTLSNENDSLKDRLAAANMDADKQAVVDTLAGLRAEIVALENELDAVKSSRDICMRENADMKDQLRRQRAEIKKLKQKYEGK